MTVGELMEELRIFPRDSEVIAEFKGEKTAVTQVCWDWDFKDKITVVLDDYPT